MSSDGALAGVRVVEFAAIGPVPFCGMVLADMGAEVIRIERPGAAEVGIRRGRKTMRCWKGSEPTGRSSNVTGNSAPPRRFRRNRP